MDAGVINFAVYENGSEYLGIAKCTMPDSSNKVFTVNGAGIPGDIDVPVVGHKDAMKLNMSFVDNPASAYKLSEERVHLIDLRVAHEEVDATKGGIKINKVKHILEVMPLSTTGGDLAPATPQGVATDFSVFSIKTYINDKLVRHFDPLRIINIDASGNNLFDDIAKALGRY